MKKLSKKLRLRRGAVAVEMAVMTPLLLTLVFGMIEYGYVFTCRQALVTAVREGARVAALPGSKDEDIDSRIATYMQPLGLTGYNVTKTRATEGNPTETVQIDIPRLNISLFARYFNITGGTVTTTCSMRKEGV